MAIRHEASPLHGDSFKAGGGWDHITRTGPQDGSRPYPASVPGRRSHSSGAGWCRSHRRDGGRMSHEARGVIARGKGEPVAIETIVVPDPGPGRRWSTCRRAAWPHRPALPGGRDQRRLPVPARPRGRGRGRGGRRGRDRRVAGRLRRPQLAGRVRPVPRLPQGPALALCFATHNATQKMTLTDGTELSPALGIGAFAEKTLVAAGQARRSTRRPSPRSPACSAAA